MSSGATTRHAVPRPLRTRTIGGRAGARAGRHRLVRERVHPDACRSAAPRSSRRAAPRAPRRRRTPRSTTSATGCTARRTATGSRWPCRSDGSYGVDGGDHLELPVHLRGRRVRRSSRASTIDDFSRERIDATVNELHGGARHGEPARSDLAIRARVAQISVVRSEGRVALDELTPANRRLSARPGASPCPSCAPSCPPRAAAAPGTGSSA